MLERDPELDPEITSDSPLPENIRDDGDNLLTNEEMEEIDIGMGPNATEQPLVFVNFHPVIPEETRNQLFQQACSDLSANVAPYNLFRPEVAFTIFFIQPNSATFDTFNTISVGIYKSLYMPTIHRLYDNLSAAARLLWRHGQNTYYYCFFPLQRDGVQISRHLSPVSTYPVFSCDQLLSHIINDLVLIAHKISLFVTDLEHRDHYARYTVNRMSQIVRALNLIHMNIPITSSYFI